MQSARILRLGGILIGGVISTLLLAAFIVPPLLSWNEYRSEIESLAGNLLNQQVKIDGDIELRLLPVPIVRVGDVQILAADQDKNIAAVGSLDVSLSAIEMLFGNVSVTRLTLSEVELSLVQSQKGAWSVDGLPSSDGEEKGGIQNFQLDDFRINNSAVKLIQKDGATTDVSILDLGLNGMIPQGPISWMGTVSVHDVPLNITGRLQSLSNTIDKSISLAVSFAESTVELGGKFSQSGDFDGRLKVASANAAKFERALYKLTQQPRAAQLPTEPLELDARMKFSGPRGSVETKRFMLGTTTARAEMSFLGKGKQHFSTRLEVGAINLDQWQYLKASNVPSSNDKKININKDLFGDIEVTVDSIQWHGEAVRQIDVAIGLDGGKVNITKVQALVPGGGTLSLGGQYQISGGKPYFAGRVGLKTGGLRNLLVWFGADISQITEDRLMSLDWRSAMILEDKNFLLQDINATIDSSKIKGSLGFSEDFSLSDVALDIDKINLDAYIAKSDLKTPQPNNEQAMNEPNHINVVIGDLIYEQTRIKNLKLVADSAEKGPVAISGSAEAFGGSVNVTGEVKSVVALDNINLTVKGAGLDKTTLLGYLDEEKIVPRSLVGNKLGFTVKLEGLLDNLSVDASVKSGSESLSGKGSLSIVDGTVEEMDLFGKLEIARSKDFMTFLGIEGAKGPISLDLTVAGKMESDLALRMAGMIAGSEIISKGVWTTKAQGRSSFKGDINLAVGDRRSLPSSLQYMPALAGMRLKSDITYDAVQLAMNTIDMVIAGGRVTGSVVLSGHEHKNIKGAITADGVQLEDTASKPSTLSRPWSKQKFYLLPTSGMKGSLDVAIKSFSYKGQDVTNSKGKISFTGTGLGVSFTKLNLNGGPAKFAASIAESKDLRKVDLQVDAKTIRMASLLKSMTGSIVTDGNAQLSFTASGRGNSELSLVSSLVGQGNLHATAGTFKFLNLVKLAGALRNPASGVGAIQSIGGLLGKGNTSFNKLDGTMVMDKGILTLTSLKGAGDWGKLNLAGPINLVSQEMNLAGVIVLNQPQDVPEIGMRFTGPISQPRKKFNTDVLLRYVLAKANIISKQDAENAVENNMSPTEALVGKAFDFLGKLKKKKDEKKDNEGN